MKKIHIIFLLFALLISLSACRSETSSLETPDSEPTLTDTAPATADTALATVDTAPAPTETVPAATESAPAPTESATETVPAPTQTTPATTKTTAVSKPAQTTPAPKPTPTQPKPTQPAPTEPKKELIKIPDISDTDETTAKNVLSSNGLIPSVKYEYSNEIAEGNVIRTEPAIGTDVEKNTKVTLYVSQGPEYIEAKHAQISYLSISNKQDEWHFYTTAIIQDVLYIDCDVAFAVDMEWEGSPDSDMLLGIASLSESFDRTVPVAAYIDKKAWRANEMQSFILMIPLNNLGDARPTKLCINLFAENNIVVDVIFYMTW